MSWIPVFAGMTECARFAGMNQKRQVLASSFRPSVARAGIQRACAVTTVMFWIPPGLISAGVTFFRGSFSCRLGRATFDENIVPPWTRRDFRGFEAVTDNLVWVVDPEPHPGAAVKASQAFTPSDGGDFQRKRPETVNCKPWL